MTLQDARSLLAKFGLESDEVARALGEPLPRRAHARGLALLMASGANLLVLDEPTNHLDLPAIEQLESALNAFDGTLLLVTHDRALLEAVELDRTIELGADGPMSLIDVVPYEADADVLYEAFLGWAEEQGLTLYPHQEEAAIELFSGNNVILATPTGSGKSMVAIAAHFAALADDRVTYYTAPIKALVSEKFFALCSIFGAENVGMLTGDASVNSRAPIIACTAEVLANIALREGEDADIGQVVMDEFHFYAEPQRGWAWQVPLLTLPQAQFLLMSATLGTSARCART